MIKRIIRLLLFREKWRQYNKDNHTTVKRVFDISKVTVGKETYGSLNIYDYSASNEKLIIGNYCSISSDVKFILGGNHIMTRISTFPFEAYIFREGDDSQSKGGIVVGDDVWIGMNAIILSGVSIGQGAVIAAGSVVTKNVEPYSVVAGNPAKVLKYRFDEQMIDLLRNIDYSKLSPDLIKNNKKLFMNNASQESVQKLLKVIEDEQKREHV